VWVTHDAALLDVAVPLEHALYSIFIQAGRDSGDEQVGTRVAVTLFLMLIVGCRACGV